MANKYLLLTVHLKSITLRFQYYLQEVCEHFESVLKITNMVKTLVCDLNHTKPSRVKASGVIPLIPDGEPLGNAIYSSCVSLIQHILGRTRGCVGLDCSPRTQEKHSKEVCKQCCLFMHYQLSVSQFILYYFY